MATEHTANMERIPLEIVPREVLAVARQIHEGGFGVWFVGGALRDILLGRHPKDWDLATSASPGDVIRLFRKVIPVGLRHGTVSVHWNGAQVEVTSVPSGDAGGILADLGRRDFTVNAMALTYPDGFFVDPQRGRRDLLFRTLRAVEDAGARFREDPLRILRACRFVAQYGFRVHDTVFRSMTEEVRRLEMVARERIRDEIFRLVQGERVADALELMRRTGVLGIVLPELTPGVDCVGGDGHGADVYSHTVAVVGASHARLLPRLAALFHALAGVRSTGENGTCSAHDPQVFQESAAVAVRVLTRWRASGLQIREVAALVANQVPIGISRWSAAALRSFISNWPPATPDDVLDLARADRICSSNADCLMEELAWFRSRVQEILESGQALTLRQLAVDGADVMDVLGLGPGPTVGVVLRSLLERVLEDPGLNERKILMDFLKKTGL